VAVQAVLAVQAVQAIQAIQAIQAVRPPAAGCPQQGASGYNYLIFHGISQTVGISVGELPIS